MAPAVGLLRMLGTGVELSIRVTGEGVEVVNGPSQSHLARKGRGWCIMGLGLTAQTGPGDPHPPALSVGPHFFLFGAGI